MRRAHEIRCIGALAAFGALLPACRHAARPPALFPTETIATVKVEDLIEGPLASDGTRLFVTTRAGAIKAFDDAGAPLWIVDGLAGGIAATSGVLVSRSVDGIVSCLDPETGAIRWKSATGIAGSLPPVIDLDRVLVAGQGMVALDLATGHALWSLPLIPTVTAPPVADGSWTLLGESDGTLRCRDRFTGLSLWDFKTDAALLAPPLPDSQRRVFLGTTDRRILSLKPGKKRASWRWPVGADVQNPGALRKSRLYFAAFDDVLYCLKRGNGHLLWRASLPSRPLSGPILVGEAILIACHESDLTGYDARTGRKLGGFKTPTEICASPLLVQERLYVGLRDGSIMIYKLNMTPASPPPPAPSRPGAGARQRPF